MSSSSSQSCDSLDLLPGTKGTKFHPCRDDRTHPSGGCRARGSHSSTPREDCSLDKPLDSGAFPGFSPSGSASFISPRSLQIAAQSSSPSCPQLRMEQSLQDPPKSCFILFWDTNSNPQRCPIASLGYFWPKIPKSGQTLRQKPLKPEGQRGWAGCTETPQDQQPKKKKNPTFPQFPGKMSSAASSG